MKHGKTSANSVCVCSRPQGANQITVEDMPDSDFFPTNFIRICPDRIYLVPTSRTCLFPPNKTPNEKPSFP
jgi:hypothetical protein